MFNRIRNLFGKTEQVVGAKTEQHPLGKVQLLGSGRFGLFNATGSLVYTYNRERDAIRGAARRGITIG